MMTKGGNPSWLQSYVFVLRETTSESGFVIRIGGKSTARRRACPAAMDDLGNLYVVVRLWNPGFLKTNFLNFHISIFHIDLWVHWSPCEISFVIFFILNFYSSAWKEASLKFKSLERLLAWEGAQTSLEGYKLERPYVRVSVIIII